MRKTWVAFLLFAFTGVPVWSGSSEIVVPVKLDQTYQVKVYLYVPANYSPSESRVLMAIHGITRKAEEMRDDWKYLADHHNLIIAAPLFDKRQFPNKKFHRANVFTRDGKVRPSGQWSYQVIERAFDAVLQKTGSKASGYFLYGSSAGAQFIHRMMLLIPSSRAKLAVAANAGYYTIPNTREPFPYGLGGLNLSESHLKNAFQRNVIILLGEKDNDPNHKYLPHGSKIDRQGPHRFARGHYFFKELQKAASNAGASLRWRIAYAPQVGHGGWRLIYRAAQIMFPDSPRVTPAVRPFIRTRWGRQNEYASKSGSKKLSGYTVTYGQVFHYLNKCPSSVCTGFRLSDLPEEITFKTPDNRVNALATYLAQIEKRIDSRRKTAREFGLKQKQRTYSRDSKAEIEAAIEQNLSQKRPLVLNLRSTKKSYRQFVIDGYYRAGGKLYVHLVSYLGLMDGWYDLWEPVDIYNDLDYRRVIWFLE